jgi:hypothetical protein
VALKNEGLLSLLVTCGDVSKPLPRPADHKPPSRRDIRDLVACGAACGVCTAFKAPVGGVFFAMEMSTR